MNELGPEARGILEGGRAGDEPTAGDRARMRASILRAIAAGGAIGAASTAAETSAAAGLKVGALSAWKLVAGMLAAGIVLGAGAGVVENRVREEAPPSTPAVVTVATATPPAARPAEAVPAAPSEAIVPVRPAAAPAAIPAPATPRPSAAPPASVASEAPSPPPPPPEDTLAAETQALREAHGAMQGGDPTRALALLDEQQARGPALREERAAARVLALCQLGRADEGRAAAARFLEESPRSPLADRVRAACPAGGSR